MKIAITGAHKVGKTSLVDQLERACPDYQCLPEPYFALEEMGHSFSEIPNLEDYLLQLEYAIEQISAYEDQVIFDRCPIDLLAYIQVVDEFEEIDIPALYQKVQEAMAELDLLVFVPIEEPDLIGCSAFEMPELRMAVNELLEEWVREFDIEVIEVEGAPEARKRQVINILSV